MRSLLRHKRDEGATAIEFALLLPVLLTIVLFTLYGALYLYYAAVAEHVARAAVRDATLPAQGTSSYPSDSDVYKSAADSGSALIPSPTSVQVTEPADASNPPHEGDPVTVTVTYQLPAVATVARMLWFMPTPTSSITRTATGRRE